MTHKRSGLLSGLVIGLPAALVGTAALGAAVLFEESLPEAVMSSGGGLSVLLGLSVLIALLVALAIGAVRPRSLLLPPIAALYAGGAVVAGQIAGTAVLVGAKRNTPSAEPGPAVVGDITPANFNTGLQDALTPYRDPLALAWPDWAGVAVAAVAALALVTFRVVRVRRTQRIQEAAEEPKETREPEYRAPFEPAQQPTPKPTADLFTPCKPAKD
ncbi:hypothetical protein AB0I81_53495 [Nonomuraea sp. NPDC050404]|uniref:hypothetical protein n=1 Tax=Nonomuraea sp. NPDC050404 TaxID=3155783 RepID=UPI0033F1235E